MKVAFVISGKSPKTVPGGLGAYAYSVARVFHGIGFRVFILGFSPTEEVLDLGFAELVHVRNPYSRLLGLGAVLAKHIFVRKMAEIAERERPEELVVYSAGVWGIAGVALRERLKHRPGNLKVLAAYFTTPNHEYGGHVRGAPIEDYGRWAHLLVRALALAARFINWPVERRMLLASDGVVVHYRSTHAMLRSELPALDERKITRIPYYSSLYDRTSDIPFADRGKAGGDLPTVTVLCRQDPRKGINVFLRAVKILKDRGVGFHCLVVGSGIFLERNKRLAERFGLTDLVRFPGFVESAEAVLDSTDIFVLPSLEEGAGAISLLEAMQKGIAIVTTACDGIPEDFIPGETALLVEPGDAGQLAAAIERLVTDQDLRGKLARSVKADYARRFTFDGMQKGIRGLVGGEQAGAGP